MNADFKPYPFEAKHYPARVPELDHGREKQRHAVTIVGGGPVGLAIALGLAKHGVRSVLIEADDSVCYGSRAICISRRSLEIIERLGALDGFLAKGLPWTGGRSFYRDDEVLHFTMPQDENQKLPPMVNLAQYHIEQFLLDAAERHADLIDIRWGTKVTAVQQDAHGATLTLTTPAGDYVAHTDWLVAADGGRSTVREALGLKLTGTSYEGRYVIVDILLDSARPTERLAYFDPASNPGSTVLVHKQPDNVWRIDYQLRDGEDAEAAIQPENVVPRVQSLLDMMGETAPWSPVWITIYKANALTLERYRHGRVLFAGDAAHLVPIFGVRGANSGIDDADNLAWKLAFVVQGRAGEALLDSYSDERVHAAHENLSYGTKSTEFMAPPSFAFELMRTAVLSLAREHPAVRSLINPRQTSAIAYTQSPLNAASDALAAGPAPGATLPECPLTIVDREGARDGHLTDFVGPCFTALYFVDDAAQPGVGAAIAALETAFADGAMAPAPLPVSSRVSSVSIVPVARRPPADVARRYGWDSTGRLFAMVGAQPGTLYLVRPDGHVLGRWQGDAPADAHANASAIATKARAALDHALQAPSAA
ncbi:FAD-dependent oxidoreductase [Paraburkholderia acidisoli]|uniref:FAD-dependent oxidoreductase n=1 Tax=Paraburkholderia acidisoli TaxID=2571748 RepID=A0A7Z2GMA1_9BURK|nr:FAD-dependent oxidoreductase [Paraburkholderia acidisoli]QGZ64410.1 FAD-dependent oxidoreductase [Paraburkholderia acidisoli]